MNRCKYKASYYNMIIHKTDGIAVYNTQKGKLIRSFGENAIIVKDILAEQSEYQSTDKGIEIEQKLYDEGFLVDSERNEIAELEESELRGEGDEYLRLIILPTEACNFRCIYCYEHFLRGRMSKEVQDSIIDFVEHKIDSYKGLIVSWFGGEPVCALDIVQYLSEAFIGICKRHKKVYNAGISTNGYDLTVDKFFLLKSLHVTEYQVTIDGPKEVHDGQRVLANGEGTFEKIVANLLNIKKRVHSCAFTMVIRTNFSKTMMPYIDEFREFVNSHFGDDDRFTIFWQFASDYGYVRDETVRDIFFEVDQFSLLFANYIKNVKNDYVLHMYQPSGSVCYAMKRNAFVMSSDGIIKKCTCDLEAEENNFGKVGIYFDNQKHERWLHSRDISHESKCYRCIKRPICHNRACYKAIECAPHLEKMEEIIEWLAEDSKNYITI